MSILEFLGLERGAAGARGSEVETVQLIVRQLEALPPERARFLASFAYVLSRVARADLTISDDETQTMERIVRDHGDLPADQASVVVRMALSRSLIFGGTEDFLVTRELRERTTREQKLTLLDCLFRVSAADETICAAEDHVVRRIADELGLEHRDFIAVRSRFKDRLGVLKPREPR
jgi:uncharacterized tellurite resistance protein B-like protein